MQRLCGIEKCGVFKDLREGQGSQTIEGKREVKFFFIGPCSVNTFGFYPKNNGKGFKLKQGQDLKNQCDCEWRPVSNQDQTEEDW